MQHDTRAVSIRGGTIRYLTIFFLVVLAAVMIVATVGAYSSREAVTRHEVLEFGVLSRDIGDLDLSKQVNDRYGMAWVMRY